jgi:ElaB/YqjD/DUF883 family membrane-anchored ribosome-binding protein
MTHVSDADGGEQGLTDQASAKVQEAASVGKEKASELRSQGSSWLRDRFDDRSNQVGSQVRSLADALRRGGNELRYEGNTNGYQLAEQASDRLGRLGSYLEQKSGDEVMHDLERFARRRPWMIAALGTLAGLAAARFMKASSEERYGAYRRGNGQQWPTRSGLSEGRGAVYEQGEPRGGNYGVDPAIVGSSPASDEPLARDPYATRR